MTTRLDRLCAILSDDEHPEFWSARRAFADSFRTELLAVCRAAAKSNRHASWCQYERCAYTMEIDCDCGQQETYQALQALDLKLKDEGIEP